MDSDFNVSGWSRRQMVQALGGGLGSVALAQLVGKGRRGKRRWSLR